MDRQSPVQLATEVQLKRPSRHDSIMDGCELWLLVVMIAMSGQTEARCSHLHTVFTAIVLLWHELATSDIRHQFRHHSHNKRNKRNKCKL